MIKVKNKKAITGLSRKSLKANRLRNVMAVLAIALTSLLFTSLFTVGGGLLKTFELSTCRQVGTTSHAGYKYLTQENYEAVKSNPLVKDCSYDIFVAVADNPELSKEQVEIRYSEDQNAKWSFAYPETGAMPKEYKDLAVSTVVLDALGIPHELGQEIPLTFTANRKEYSDTFTLCGFWEGDKALPAQELWLSREYVSDVAPTPTEAYEPTPEKYDKVGYLSGNLFFKNSWNIGDKMDRLTAECDLDEGSVNGGVNWAYAAAEVDPASIMLVTLVLALIFVSGYLIIYNVFYISVWRDIRYYGLLKTVGMTGKQLKVLVRRQVLFLAVPGIALGLVLGWCVGAVVLPVVLVSTYFEGEATVSADPLIFLGAAVFSGITVWVSCSKPARLAAKVSPIEALRSQEGESGKKSGRRKAKKQSMLSMAVRNVFRSKKKVAVVVVSLSLSLILLNVTYGTVKSFDMDKYLEQNVIADFNVANQQMQNRYDLTYLEEDLVAQMEALDGVEKAGRIYMQESVNTLTDQAKERIGDMLVDYADVLNENTMGWFADAVTNGSVRGHIYGFGKDVTEKLTVFSGELDWEKFAGGDYVLTTPFISAGEDYSKSMYEPGDKIVLDFDNGKTKEYTVMAVVDLPFAMSCLHSHGATGEYIIPESEYLAQSDVTEVMRLVMDAHDGMVTQVETELQKIRERTDIDYVSKAEEVKNFQADQQKYVLVGGFLSAVLGLIGILNFLNSMVTSIYARRQELAMLQSIGMTSKQMRKMLVLEGMLYAVLTLAIVLTVGNLLSYWIINMVAGMVWYYTYYFSILPILLCIPVIVLAVILVPAVCFHNVQKRSVVERLREVE